MAEPEDLEEDLFADLYSPFSCRIYVSMTNICSSSYDADESTNRTTSAVEPSKPADPVAAEPAPAPAQSAVPSYDPSPSETYQTQAPAQPEYGNDYQNGSEGAGAHTTPTPADNESHGTGIKEDG